MNKNLLIVGAGVYAVVASEIAADMGCFDEIAFVDDKRLTTPNGIAVIGTTNDLNKLALQYSNVIVAIGNPKARLSLLRRIAEETSFRVVSLLSPKAYISPSAQIDDGCIIEPMAVIHSGCVLEAGCIVSAGAVVNHSSACGAGVHVDCNATVTGYCTVPSSVKIDSGKVYKDENIRV